jgi:hypothetical protein
MTAVHKITSSTTWEQFTKSPAAHDRSSQNHQQHMTAVHKITSSTTLQQCTAFLGPFPRRKLLINNLVMLNTMYLLHTIFTYHLQKFLNRPHITSWFISLQKIFAPFIDFFTVSFHVEVLSFNLL